MTYLSSHIVWIAVEPDLDTRSAESVAQLFPSDYSSLWDGWQLFLNQIIIFARLSMRLSWSVCTPSLDTREFDLEIKHPGYKHSILSIIGLTCSGKSSFHEAYMGN